MLQEGNYICCNSKLTFKLAISSVGCEMMLATKILSGCSWFFFDILRCFLLLVLKQSKSYRTGTFRSKIGHTSKILSIFGESPRSLVRTEHHAVILEDVSNYTTNLALTNHIQLFLPVTYEALSVIKVCCTLISSFHERRKILRNIVNRNVTDVLSGWKYNKNTFLEGGRGL